MTFSNPSFLFALTGMAIPIAIHLLNRKEGKIIMLGSVRHVLETSTQQFKGIRLNEILLLVLRCSMIIIFSLLLSGLQCTQSNNQKWVLIEKALEKNSAIRLVLDSLQNESYELHWLAEEFPMLKDSARITSTVNYWNLLHQLENKNLSQVVVFSQSRVNNFQGLRNGLPKNIRWISLAPPPKDFSLNATQLKNDSALLRVGHTDASQTNFISQKINSSSSPIKISPPDTIKIVLVADADFFPSQRIVETALAAIESSLPVKIKITKSDSKQFASKSADWLIWLSSQKINGKFARLISFDPQPSSEIIRQTEPRHWIFTKRLDQEIALRENVTLRLAEILIQKNEEKKIAEQNDQRMLSDSIAWPSENYVEANAVLQQIPVDEYLIALLFAILLIERIVAYRKNQ